MSSNVEQFLQDVLGNIVGNTLTDVQKMEILETTVRMLIDVHRKLDKIDKRLKDIDNTTARTEHYVRFHR